VLVPGGVGPDEGFRLARGDIYNCTTGTFLLARFIGQRRGALSA